MEKQSLCLINLSMLPGRDTEILLGMRLVQQVGRRSAENFSLKGLHRLGINEYSFTSLFLFGTINVVDCYLHLYNFIRSFVVL